AMKGGGDFCKVGVKASIAWKQISEEVSKAINDVGKAINTIAHSCLIPVDATDPSQGTCNKLEKCAPGCPPDPNVSLSCADATAALDEQHHFYWHAVANCDRGGIRPDAASVNECA